MSIHDDGDLNSAGLDALADYYEEEAADKREAEIGRRLRSVADLEQQLAAEKAARKKPVTFEQIQEAFAENSRKYIELYDRLHEAERERDALQRQRDELVVALDKWTTAADELRSTAVVDGGLSEHKDVVHVGQMLDAFCSDKEAAVKAILRAHVEKVAGPLVEASRIIRMHLRHTDQCLIDSEAVCNCGMWSALDQLDAALAAWRKEHDDGAHD